MSKHNNIDQLIENYGKGKLEGKELEEFENMLQEDPEIRRKLKVFTISNQLVILNKLREVNALVKEETIRVKNTGNNFGTTGKILAGISILAVVSTVLFFTLKNQKDPAASNLPGQEQKQQKSVVIPEVTASRKEEPLFTPAQKDSKKPDISPRKEMQQEPTPPAQNEIAAQTEFTSPDIQVVSDSAEEKNKQVISTSAKADTTRTVENKKSCEDVRIQADFKTETPCAGQKNGGIFISQVKGGASPYMFVLNETEENSEGRFTDLGTGIYQVKIIDKNGCDMISESLTLSVKACKIDLEFSPFRGDECKLPVYEKSGNIRIFDKSGRLFYHETIPAGEQIIWNGKSGSGEMNAGYYVFIIQYQDGFVQNGSITITP